MGNNWKKPGTEYGVGVLVALLTLLLLLVFGLSCTRNEFTVEVELPEDASSHYTLLYYASDPAKGWLVENVVTPVDGKMTMRGITRNPTVVYIFGNGRHPATVLYAERGDRLECKASSGQPSSWVFSGNGVTERLTGWISTNKELLKGDAAAVNKQVAAYVEKNHEDPVSTILLLTFYDRGEDEKGFRRLWGMLSGDASKEKWTTIAGRADLLAFDGSFADIPKEFVVNSVENGADTVRLGKVPVLLYFSRQGVTDRDLDIKALRRVSDSWPDSSGRIIADIGFDADSASRAWPVKRDSLRNAIHAWMPLGPADSTAMRLRVSRVPLFILFDAGGKEIYRGDDRDRAAELFLSAKK